MIEQPAPVDDPVATERQLESFIGKFTPEIAALTRAARARLRRRMPEAIELVYDNYNALAIGFASSEKTSHVAISLAVYSSGPLLYFYYGAALADPMGLLRGSGNQGRHIRLTSMDVFDEPGVDTLIGAAIDHGRLPMPTSGGGYTIIRSISAKQRPRRPKEQA